MNSLLWYAKPATEWKEGLPIGNGVLAGMVLGTYGHDRLALNHEWLWRGKNRRRDFEPRHQHLAEIRRLFFEGKAFEAGTLANETLGGLGGVSGQKNRVDPYQPLGDLTLAFEGEAGQDYHRELDLASAIAATESTVAGVRVRREFLAHAEHRVMAVRISAAEGEFAVTAGVSRIEDSECRLSPWARADAFGLVGEFPEGVGFAVEACLVLSPGTVATPHPAGGSVRLEQCREAVILLSAAVSVAPDGGDPEALCREPLARAPRCWEPLAESHTREHGRRYGRVALDLDAAGRDDTPTDERLASLRAGRPDDGLLALYFNLGRYLLIASSFGAELPANLQGKWNEQLDPPWQCDLHHDVNLQMNYWPAEVCNLSETTAPLFAHLERFVPHAREAARKLYDCEGIWLPIQTDPWGRSTPEARGWDVWTGAAAWLAQHFWWRYEYGRDEEFLRRRAYPFLKEVAAFYRSYLIHDCRGRLVTVPSQSPENTFRGGTTPVSLCVAATMDLELIHDVLTHAIRASEILDVDEGLRGEWRRILGEIPPLQIGRHGQVQEWLEDYEEAEPGHRHISHLFALYPGDQVTPEDTPEMAQAARVSLERRLAHEGGHTGWSRSWTVCCFARLCDGDNAYRHLCHLVGDFATDTLLDLHPPRIFQIDGNFGGTAGIAEMLLQSHGGVIRVLPALPSAWPRGEVTGLCARGGFVVDVRWEDGRPVTVRVHSRLGGPCRMALPAPATLSCDGRPVEAQTEGQMLSWQTEAGRTYTLAAG